MVEKDWMRDIIEASFDVKEPCGGEQAGAMGIRRVELLLSHF